jgi:hypothetical protein
MKSVRYFLTVIVVGLLITVTFTTNFTGGTDGEETSPPQEETIGVECHVVWDGETFVTHQRISLEDARLIRDLCIKASIAFKLLSSLLPFQDASPIPSGFMDNNHVSVQVMREMLLNTTEKRVNDLTSVLTRTGILPPGVTGVSMMSLGLLPGTGMDFLTPVLSMGVGYGYIPNYNGEAFMGFMLRPLFLSYLLGYTGSLNFVLLPPRVAFWDKFGPHFMSIMGFAGIYLKLGELGTGMFPIQIIMGECLFLMKGMPQTMVGNAGQSFQEYIVGWLVQRYIQRNFPGLNGYH